MLVVPVINCKNFGSAKEKLKEAVKFLPKNGWIQIDISDGKFTKAKTKITPSDLKNLNIIAKKYKLNLEVHLMVENPEKIAGDWTRAGAKRVLVHIEAIKNIKPLLMYKNKIGLAIKYNSPALKAFSYLRDFKFILILAVKPGFSGQKFNSSVLQEIKWIKSKFPKAVVEIDGGIDLETAKLVKKAGADIIVSESYIWSSKNPKQAYQNLVV